MSKILVQGVMADAYDSKIRESEAGELQIKGFLGLYSKFQATWGHTGETPSQKKKNRKGGGYVVHVYEASLG